MTPLQQFDQMLRLQDALDRVKRIGDRRKMKQSDIDALIQSLEHIAKTTKVVDKHS